MVFQHHTILVIEEVILGIEVGVGGGDGEGAAGGGHQAVAGDDVDGVGGGGGAGRGAGHPQVLSQVHPSAGQAGGGQLPAAEVLHHRGGAAAGAGDQDHPGVRH